MDWHHPVDLIPGRLGYIGSEQHLKFALLANFDYFLQLT